MRYYVFCLIFVMCFTFSCKKEMSPEEKIRAQIEEIRDYANKRQIGKIMEYISPDYKDAYGNRRETIKGILIQNLMFRKNVRVIIKDINVQIEQNDAAAQIGLFVKEGEGIIPDNADIIKIEVRLIRSGSVWLITSAHWKSGASPF
ncbi:MAG: hypothetical protein N3B13_08310 [Deltaproteobacteria bacterium]|nr:hypothetical protein [Deltaproteobacteria bacterium]